MVKNKKLLFIAVALIVVIVAAVLFVNNRKDDTGDSQDSSQSSEQNDADAALLGETFTDEEASITLQIPKGWELASKNEENPNSLTKFVKQENSGKTLANGELTRVQTKAHIDDIIRVYLEAAMDINATPKLVANQDVRMGDRVVRLLAQEVPGPNNQVARITQYIFYQNEAYYVLSYTMLAPDWEQQQQGVGFGA